MNLSVMDDKLTEIRTKRLEEVTSLDLAWLYKRVDVLEEENKCYKETIEKASDELGRGDSGNAVIRADRILVNTLKHVNELKALRGES